MSNKIKGIFILGGHRSGTTMLANIIASQRRVCGVTHKKHFGIYESSFFSHLEGRYGDISIRNNYLEFISVMSQYDYFKIMKFNFDKLKKLHPKNYKDFFQITHNIYARNQNALYWIEKTPNHLLFLEKIINNFPNNKYIFIRRDLFEILESSYNLSFDKKINLLKEIFFIIKFTIIRYVYDDIINKNHDKILKVDYKKLINKDRIEFKKIEKYLKIKINPNKNKFKKNSSYSKKKKIALNKNYKYLILIIRLILTLVPISILRNYKIKQIKKDAKALPSWFFSLS